jgi:hypothetical protein
MKEEIGHLPKSLESLSGEKCQYCRTPLSWSVINKRDKENFYSDEDYLEYSKILRKYICNICTRNNKIDSILN